MNHIENIIVYISYHFPPGIGVGGKRIVRLIRLFGKSDFDYRVVTVNQGHAEGEILEGNTDRLFDQDKIFYLNCPSTISSFFDGTFGWYKAALNRSCECVEDILQQNDNCDKVIIFSSQPPAVTHYIALKIKEIFSENVYWIADFRDPWTEKYWGAGRLIKFYQKYLQSKVLQNADLVLTTTDKVVPKFSQDISGKYYCLPNSVDTDIFDDIETRPSSSKIILTHLGDLDYDWRDPGAFLEAFSLAGQAGIECDFEDIEIHFWGRHGEWNGKTIEDYIAEFNLQAQVFVHGFIPHAEALAEILSCDMLVLFAMNQKAQIPSKVYEYLFSRKPILAFCEKDSATGELLSKFSQATIIETYDAVSISEELRPVLSRLVNRSSLDIDTESVNEITTEVVVGNFISFLYEELR